MAYETIIQILRDNGEADTEVDHAFVMKIGCFSFRRFEEPTPTSQISFSTQGISLLEKDKIKGTLFDFESEIIEALRKHPNVFDIAKLEEATRETIRMMHEDAIFSGNVFSLRIQLPERLQKHRSLWFSKRPPPEEFQVVSFGSIFAAFSQIKEYPVRTNFGQEYRDLFVEQINKETKLKCRVVPPCPMHPEVYVVLRKRRKQDDHNETKILSVRKDLVFVTDLESRSDVELVVQLLQYTSFRLLIFYGLELGSLFLDEYQREILDHFTKLSSTVEQLSATRWWKFIKAAVLARRGKEGLSQVYTLLVRHGVEQLGQVRSRDRFLKAIEDDTVLYRLDGYLSEITELETQVPELLPVALKYFETELQTFGNIRSIIIASLVGAVVGALLTAVVAHAF